LSLNHVPHFVSLVFVSVRLSINVLFAPKVAMYINVHKSFK